MNSFQKISCPSCGGNVDISKNTSHLVCNYCKNSFLVKREGDIISLEYFASCPLCNRNDKSQRVAAIFSRESASGSLLANQLAQPIKPQEPVEPSGCFSYILLLLVINAGIQMFAGSVAGIKDNPRYFGGFDIFVFIAIILITSWISFKILSGIQKRKSQYENNKLNFPNSLRKWELALKKWQQLYYCERDGIVFIPGENKHVDASNINNILFE